MRLARYLTAASLTVCGLLFGLYGLFAFIYRGDGPHASATYVDIAGSHVDARLVGGFSFAIAAPLLLAALMLTRRRIG